MRTTSNAVVMCLVATLIGSAAEPVAAQSRTRVEHLAATGEQAPRSDRGQKNFGGFIATTQAPNVS